MAEQLNVYQRLAEVRKKVSYLKKEQSGSQFNYVGSSDVLGALHSKINEMGLLLQPAITGHKVKDQIEIINHYNKYTKQTEQKQRITYFTELEMTMRWINIDDPEDFLESKWYAQGVDIAGEKGVGKALTYAEKYFLLKFFNIATDKDDPDSFQKKLDAKEPINLVNGKQISEMNDLIRKVAELSSSDMQVVRNGLLQHVGAQTLDSMTDKQYPEAMRQLNKWKSNYEIEINKNNTNDQVKNINWGQR